MTGFKFKDWDTFDFEQAADGGGGGMARVMAVRKAINEGAGVKIDKVTAPVDSYCELMVEGELLARFEDPDLYKAVRQGRAWLEENADNLVDKHGSSMLVSVMELREKLDLVLSGCGVSAEATVLEGGTRYDVTISGSCDNDGDHRVVFASVPIEDWDWHEKAPAVGQQNADWGSPEHIKRLNAGGCHPLAAPPPTFIDLNADPGWALMYEVVNEDTGEIVPDVFQVDTKEDVAWQYVRGDNGVMRMEGSRSKMRRVTGSFTLRRIG